MAVVHQQASSRRIRRRIVITLEWALFEHHQGEFLNGWTAQKMSSVLPCQIHLKWWVDQIWDASSHKVRSSNLVSWRLPLSQCVHKSAQWELFYHASSPRFKTQFESCQIKRRRKLAWFCPYTSRRRDAAAAVLWWAKKQRWFSHPDLRQKYFLR